MSEPGHIAELVRVIEQIEAEAQEMWKASKTSTYLEGKADGLDRAALLLRRHLQHNDGSPDGRTAWERGWGPAKVKRPSAPHGGDQHG